jgi:predicted amino acid dehydrogenase
VVVNSKSWALAPRLMPITVFMGGLFEVNTGLERGYYTIVAPAGIMPACLAAV